MRKIFRSFGRQISPLICQRPEMSAVGWIFACLLVLLTGCGKEAGNTASSASTVQGMVHNGSAIVTNATIGVTDSTGATVATTTAGSDASYTVQIPASAVYPVVLTATGGTLSGPGAVIEGDLKAVLISPGDASMNLTVDSTRIVNMALARGGLTRQNIAAATAAVLQAKPDTASGGSEGHH